MLSKQREEQQTKLTERDEQKEGNQLNPKIGFIDFYRACKSVKNNQLSFKSIAKLYCFNWAQEIVNQDTRVAGWDKEDKLGYTKQLAKDLFVRLSEKFNEKKTSLQAENNASLDKRT